MTPPARRPLEDETDPDERAAREERARRIVRSLRVEARGLPGCVICGGVEGDVDDETLKCDCQERAAALRARVARLVHERRNFDSDASNRIVP